MLEVGSRFESFKCNLGDEAMGLPSLRLTIPGLLPGLNHAPYVENSQIIISKQELEAVFNKQVAKVCSLIANYLSQVNRFHPDESVTYLVLSGSLGSSVYLRKILRQRYFLDKNPFICAHDIQILRVAKPQLTVCHGPVLDGTQQIRYNRVVYKERFSRNSYGIVVQTEYD